MTNVPVTIVYTPGTYGSYFHWALRTVAGFDTVDNPLSFEGNSHGHKNTWIPSQEFRAEFDQIRADGKSLADEFWTRLLEEFDRSQVTVSAHPSLEHADQATFNKLLSRIASTSDHVLLIHPREEVAGLVLNNIASKIHEGGEEAWLEEYLSVPDTWELVTSRWEVDPNTKVSDVPRWIVREFLSLQLFPSWLDLIGKTVQDFENLPSNVHVIDMENLLSNILSVLQNATSETGLTFDYDLFHTKVANIHKEMLSKQRYLDISSDIRAIVDYAIRGSEMTIHPQSLVSESLIQYYLREEGYEMRCFDLDNFPTNTVQLNELIYKEPA